MGVFRGEFFFFQDSRSSLLGLEWRAIYYLLSEFSKRSSLRKKKERMHLLMTTST